MISQRRSYSPTSCGLLTAVHRAHLRLSVQLWVTPPTDTVTKLQWLAVLVLDYGRNLLLDVNQTKEMLTDFKRKRKDTPPVGC